MRPENQAKLKRIEKAGIVLRVICKVLMALAVLVGICGIVFVISGVGGITYEGNLVFGSAGLPIGHRLVLGAATALTWAVLLNCLFRLHQLFGSYSRGEVFTRESVRHMRQFGIGCLLWGAMNFAWALFLALSLNPPKTFPGHADAFVLGAIVIVIAWFMDMAVDIQEENQLTI
jgi:hypothetical protein